MNRPHAGALCALALLAMAPAAPSATAATLSPFKTSTGEAGKQANLYLTAIEKISQDRPYAALAHLDEYDLLHPPTQKSRLLRADCLVRTDQPAPARKIYAELLAEPAPRKPSAEQQKALRQLKAAAYAGLGRLEAKAGRWQQARQAFAAAVAQLPLDIGRLNDLGYAHLMADEPREAVMRLRQAVELSPSDEQARNNLALAVKAAGEVESAQQLAQIVPDEAPIAPETSTTSAAPEQVGGADSGKKEESQ
ncbi:hypothetical protein [Caulobacter sp. NIBR2454]|uniref:hypothetical protein n=1 Tax=Caulobacter sp. NIBR2454 TaxID=3015996 RepID=UPI0022B5E558|nr:hypothetical protein [Caulobacter sp. NIBR2454]